MDYRQFNDQLLMYHSDLVTWADSMRDFTNNPIPGTVDFVWSNGTTKTVDNMAKIQAEANKQFSAVLSENVVKGNALKLISDGGIAKYKKILPEGVSFDSVPVTGDMKSSAVVYDSKNERAVTIYTNGSNLFYRIGTVDSSNNISIGTEIELLNPVGALTIETDIVWAYYIESAIGGEGNGAIVVIFI